MKDTVYVYATGCLDYLFYNLHDKHVVMTEDISYADIVALDTDKKDVFEDAMSKKRDYAEIILCTDFGSSWLYTESVRLWITHSMTNGEALFRLRLYMRDYYERLEQWMARHTFETAINSIPNMFWVKTKDGVHKIVNSTFSKVVGKSVEECENKRHAYIWGVAEDDPQCIESENIVMNSGRTAYSREGVTTSTGEVMLLDIYKSPLYTRRGEIYGTTGVGIDITHEIYLDNALTIRNKDLEQMFKSFGCGILCYDAETNQITDVNEAALKILGYSDADAIKKAGFHTIAQSVVEEDRESLISDIKTLKNDGDIVNSSYRVQHNDGRIVYVVGDTRLVMNADGRMEYQRFMLDFTAQRMEDNEQREFNDNIIKTLGRDFLMVSCFKMTDGSGSTIFVDKVFDNTIEIDLATVTDYEQCLTSFIDRYAREEDRAELYNEFRLSSVIRKLQHQQTFVKNFNTVEDVYFRIKILRMNHTDGEGYIIFGVANVDNEMRVEAGQRVALETALYKAKEASRVKSNFMSNITHDIRTPMNAIVNYTKLCLRNPENNSKLVEYLTHIDTSSEQLLKLVNNVLDISKIEAGKMELNTKSCWLRGIIESVYSTAQATANNKNITIRLDSMGIVHEHVFCDDVRLHQVLLNVLSNAVKYTPDHGFVMFTIKEDYQKDGVGKFLFEVKDNGIGMSEEFVKHIFDSFERESNTTLSGVQGSGLGMAITKSIVDLMDGKIVVDSKKDVGTTVQIYLEFKPDTSFDITVNLEELAGKRALIVDRVYSTCDNVARILTSFNLDVDWTTQGTEAKLRVDYAMSRQKPFSVFVIDSAITDITCEELIKHIRSKVSGEVYIIMLCSSEEEQKNFDLPVGVAGSCMKPVFASTIGLSLRRALDMKVKPEEVKHESKEKIVEDKKVINESEQHILLVEDNEMNQEIALAILGDSITAGIDLCSTGKEAVDKFNEMEEGYYSVVFMDVQMPVMDGYTATQHIRALDKGKRVPIYAMTANAFDEDVKKAYECGMNGHLSKPIDATKFVSLTHACLRGENPRM